MFLHGQPVKVARGYLFHLQAEQEMEQLQQHISRIHHVVQGHALYHFHAVVQRIPIHLHKPVHLAQYQYHPAVLFRQVQEPKVFRLHQTVVLPGQPVKVAHGFPFHLQAEQEMEQ